MKKKIIFLSCGFAVMAVAVSAWAADIRGQLRFSSELQARPPTPTAERSFFWDEWNGLLEPAPRRVDVTREFTAVLTGEGTVPSRVTARLTGGQFYPTTIVARAATTLVIENTDPCAHELFAEHPEWIAVQTEAGNSRTVRMPTTGKWLLRDKLYSHVEAHLIVLEDLVAVGELTRDGNYTFGDVAPGNYTLKVFHRGEEMASRAVTVGNAPVTIDPIELTRTAR